MVKGFLKFIRPSLRILATAADPRQLKFNNYIHCFYFVNSQIVPGFTKLTANSANLPVFWSHFEQKIANN